MAHILFEVTPLNGSTPITLRMASGTPDPSGVQLNGYSWQPIITERSARTISISNDGLLSEIQSDYGTLSFWLHPDFSNEVWSSYEWTGALGRIFVGNLGDPFSSYVQTFEGSVSDMDRDGAKATVTLLGPEAALDKPLLTATYAGTGNAEGPTSLKGALKPRAFGNCLCVDPVLIDPANWIYQVHGYGAVASITAYEFAQALDPAKKKPDSANYAALAALTLVPGEWGTCLAEGLFRLGGTPAKKVSADLTFSGSQNISTIVPALLGVAGIPNAKIGSFSAFSSVGWNQYQTTQITVGEVARSALRHAGGYLIADGTGVWKSGNYFAPKTPTTVNFDQYNPAPPVHYVKEPMAPPPVWKVSVAHTRCWNVHSASDVSPAIAEISDAADAANDAAIAAQATADAAAANANAQKARLDNMVSDSVLDRSEKAQIILEASRLTAEKAGINSQATGLGITTENTAYNSAYTTWNSYLTGLSPAYTDTTQDTTGIVRATWNTRWGDLYAARQTLLNKIADIAATKANWSSVTGTGKPADNATVGATWGVNLSNQPATLAAINSGEGAKLTGIAPGATSDLALVPVASLAANGYIVTTGNTVTRAAGGAQSWTNGAFYCVKPMTGNVRLSWTPNAVANNKLISLHLHTSLYELTDATINSVPLARFSTNYGNGYNCVYNGTALTSGTYAYGDEFAITYDGVNFAWWINGAVIATASASPNLTLYLLGSIADTTGIASNIKFTTYTDKVWANVGGSGKPENNADVTLTHTSSGFTGQGGLATKNNVAWAAEITGRPANVALLTGTEGINNAANNGNLISNSDFATGDFTGWSSFAFPANHSVVLRTDSSVPSGAPTKYVGKFTTPGGGNSTMIWAAPKAYNVSGAEFEGIRVVPGEQYFVAVDAAANLAYAATAGIQVQAYYLLADGSLTGGTLTGSLAVTTTWQTFTASFTAPANSVRCWLALYSAQTFGSSFWTNLRCWQKQSVNTLTSTAVRLGTNITRNDGSTSLTDAMAVTSLGTASAIAGQGSLATLSAVDLSSSQVTNKSLANLDSTAATKLTGIAVGATKNVITTGSTAPSSPADGDVWNDTSTTPATVKLRVSGAWVVSATNVSNTNQITDGAGLGSTANWGSVASRPAELTDGRISAGLASNGDINRAIPSAIKTSSSILSYAGGGTFTGALNSTYGADLATNVTNNNLDNVTDGTSYKRLTAPNVSSGKAVVNFADAIHSGLLPVANASSGLVNSNITLSAAGVLNNAGGGSIAYDSLPNGTTYAKILASELSSGAHKLSIAGSGSRVGDSRNLPAIVSMNLGYKFTGAITYSATAGTPATATISVAAGSSLIGTNSISYSAMSANVTGTGGSTVSYFLYCDDPSFAGGAQTLIATTTANTVYSADGRVYIGSVDVFFPASGSGGGGGGGGGGYCVSARSWVETRDRGFVQASEIQPGDYLRVLTDDRTGTEWEPVTKNFVASSDAVTITSASGIALTVSVTTPITLREGHIWAPEIDGHELPVFVDQLGWEACTIKSAGRIDVAHIHCNGRTYAAGDVAGRSILTHNPAKP